LNVKLNLEALLLSLAHHHNFKKEIKPAINKNIRIKEIKVIKNPPDP